MIHTTALFDSGATTCFMDMLFGHTHSIPNLVKTKPTPIEVINKRPLLSGAIIEETIPLELIVGSHWETIAFDLISSPHQPFFLRLSRLVTHNPIVDLHRQSLDFTTRIGKTNSSLKVIHVISAPTILVRPEDNHHVSGTKDKSSCFYISTKHMKAQAATKVKPSTSIPSNYWEFSDVF
mgnify:CR=1 FL=1